MAEREPIGDSPVAGNEMIANYGDSVSRDELNGGRTDISQTPSINSVLHRVEEIFGVLTNEISLVKASVEEIKVKMVSHDDACSQVSSFVASIKSNLTAVKESVDDVECSSNLAASNTTAMRNNSQTMSKELSNIKKTLDQHSTTLSSNQQVLKSIKSTGFIISGKLSRVQASIDNLEDMPKNGNNKNNDTLSNELAEVKKILNKQKSDSLSNYKAIIRELNAGKNSTSQEISSIKLAIECLKNELKMVEIQEFHKKLSEELLLVKNYLEECNSSLSHSQKKENVQDSCSPLVAEVDATIDHTNGCKNKKHIMNINLDQSGPEVDLAQHVKLLLENTVILERDVEKAKYVQDLYEKLYSISPMISVLIKFLQFQNNVQVYIDFESEFIGRMKKELKDFDEEDSKGDDWSSFTDFEEKKIYLGGLQSDETTEKRLMGILANSLCCLSMYLVFDNGGRPYVKEDEDAHNEYVRIIEEAELRQKEANFVSCINWALDRKTGRGREVCMITAIPNIMAIHGSEVGTSLLQQQLPSMLQFYEERVMTKLLGYIHQAQENQLQ